MLHLNVSSLSLLVSLHVHLNASNLLLAALSLKLFIHKLMGIDLILASQGKHCTALILQELGLPAHSADARGQCLHLAISPNDATLHLVVAYFGNSHVLCKPRGQREGLGGVLWQYLWLSLV